MTVKWFWWVFLAGLVLNIGTNVYRIVVTEQQNTLLRENMEALEQLSKKVDCLSGRNI